MIPKICDHCGDPIYGPDYVEEDEFFLHEWCVEGFAEDDKLMDHSFDGPYDVYGTPQFYDPGGRSALRAGVRNKPCPTCGEPDRLTKEDVALGYQCDECADRLEMGY